VKQTLTSCSHNGELKRGCWNLEQIVRNEWKSKKDEMLAAQRRLSKVVVVREEGRCKIVEELEKGRVVVI